MVCAGLSRPGLSRAPRRGATSVRAPSSDGAADRAAVRASAPAQPHSEGVCSQPVGGSMRAWTWLLVVAIGGCDPNAGVDQDGDGYVGRDDCDDKDAAIHPGADEVCDDVDNDCNGQVDDADDGLTGATVWYSDADADGYGGFELGPLCDPPAASTDVPGDCDDAIINTHPGVPEVCDGIDNDCDDLIDDADPDWYQGNNHRFYRDSDDDGYGSAANSVDACEAPEGYVTDHTDCDDNDPERNPGEPEICDGKDNNCDVATGFLVDDDDPAVDTSSAQTYYRDGDRDGFGRDEAIQVCNPNTVAGIAPTNDDCDDTRNTVYPGAPEICDGRDNDCDGLGDLDDWWDTDWAFRVALDLTAPTRPLSGPPVAADVDLAAAISAAGGNGVPVANSLRLVVQDCAAGYPVIPVEFIDPIEGLFAAAANPSDTAWRGTVLFRYDTDGVWSTIETLAANDTRRVALYFNSTTRGTTSGTAPAAPAMVTSSVGGVVSVDNGDTELELDRAMGGTVTFLGLSGGDSVGAQADSDPGNGLFLAAPGDASSGDWISAVDGTSVSLSTIYSGTMLYMARASGTLSSAHGGYRYTYDYFVINGRPEVYAKVTYTTTAASHVGPQGTFWSQAVRPWQIDNLALIGAGGGTSVRPLSYDWVRASYDSDSRGIFLGWRTLPAHLSNPPTTTNGRYIALAGQDFQANPSANEADVPNNTVLLDHEVLMAMPYDGTWPSVEDDAIGLLSGVSVVPRTPEAAP
ncbi:MAG: putative metal-binding motif-containing protein [Alphaproteobacteria bacterium]|nr:putative metal-binding motif-containing protein [Alphaproteobacteria bacterium]